jgi:DNA-binding CsgD family transcriptional regulator
MDAHFVDQIYESSFVPELWPDVLAQLANIAIARSGWLFIVDGEKQKFAGSNEMVREVLEPLIPTRVIVRSQRFTRLCAARHPGFLREVDIYTDKELRSDPYLLDPLYRDVIYPRGLGCAAATTFVLPTQERVLVSFEREIARGPVEPDAIERLNTLRPHIARSALVAARLQLERARAASATLAALGLPALVLDDKGKVLAANQLIESLTGIVLWHPRDSVGLADSAADQLLHEAIANINSTNDGCARSFPVRDRDASATRVAHVIPVRLSARDIFARCVAVLTLTPITLPQAPPVELVQSLFDLTPAEARVARSLASGKAVETIAADGGVSLNTIRTHVRGVLEKTGCNRQIDVVALLTAISATRPTHPMSRASNGGPVHPPTRIGAWRSAASQ